MRQQAALLLQALHVGEQVRILDIQILDEQVVAVQLVQVLAAQAQLLVQLVLAVLELGLQLAALLPVP